MTAGCVSDLVCGCVGEDYRRPAADDRPETVRVRGCVAVCKPEPQALPLTHAHTYTPPYAQRRGPQT